jgi:hypothetical protein
MEARRHFYIFALAVTLEVVYRIGKVAWYAQTCANLTGKAPFWARLGNAPSNIEQDGEVDTSSARLRTSCKESRRSGEHGLA